MVSVQRHLNVLHGMLQPGETQGLWVRATREPQGHAGALLLTDRRLLFSGLGAFTQSQEAWPLAAVTNARVLGGGSRGELALEVLADPERFTGAAKDLERLHTEVRAVQVGLGIDPDAGGGSVVDELERLQRLREAGALSEAEFDGAKRRLLE